MLSEFFIYNVNIKFWLSLTSIIFSLGLYGFLTQTNAIRIFIAIEIMLNSVILNFVIFNKIAYPNLIDGQIISIFSIVIVTIETVAGIAILILLFRTKQSTEINDLLMKQR